MCGCLVVIIAFVAVAADYPAIALCLILLGLGQVINEE